ncbi:MAG TPA: glutathione binding-like protein, partial [Caulobacteraceae bacterium]
YTNEVDRLYGVLDSRLAGRDYIAGEYSIADMITWPWVAGHSSAAIQLDVFPNLTDWKARIGAREPVQRALAQAKEIHSAVALNQSSREAEAARKVLFGQRAR